MHRELLLLLLLVCVLCQQSVNVKRAEGAGPLHFPFSPSPPLLLSILTWSMISASLLPPPVPSHGTRSPAASLVSSLFLVRYSQQQSSPPLCSHRRGSLAADCCASPQRHGSVSPCVSECDSLIHPVKHSSLVPFLCLLFLSCCSGWRLEGKQGVRGILTSLLDKDTEGRDSRSPFFALELFHSLPV